MQTSEYTRSKWARGVRMSAASALLLSLGGCTQLADMLTPGERGTVAPASIALQANIASQIGSASDVVTLNVVLSYLRRDASRVRIGTQTMTLTSAALQPVPIGVDVASCLADPQRDGGGGSCAVVLQLALLVNGVTVDEQVIGPLRLTPGQPASVTEPVTLFEIVGVDLIDAQGALVPNDAQLKLSLGSTRALRARIRDSRGEPVTDRVVTWSSDAPQVATVSETGDITAVSLGSARLTATLGALSASAVVNVERPPAALEIVGIAGSGRGVVRSTPAGIDCRIVEASATGDCVFSFPGDANVTLRSIPDDGNVFAVWGEECASASDAGTCEVQMSSARRASARFLALRQVTLVAGAEGDGSGRVTGSSGLDCRITKGVTSGTCSVQVVDGTDVAFSAVPDTDVGGIPSPQTFAGWGGACSTATGQQCSFSAAGSDRELSAAFFDVRRLTVDIGGAGGGAVKAGTALDCVRAGGGTNGACEATFAHQSQVVLTATPDANSEFSGWTGACASTQGNTCVVSMAQARTATASFVRRRVLLTLAVQGSGAGSLLVDGTPACAIAFGAPGANCSRIVDAGTTVTLRGTAEQFSVFSGFTGDCAGTSDCQLTLSSDRTVRASFAATLLALRVETFAATSTGSGALRMLDTDTPLDCALTLGVPNGMCETSVNPFAPVSISAVAEPASALVAWGEACQGAPTVTCTFTPTAAVAVSARFVAAIDVQMNVVGTGAGTVSFNIPGVPTQNACASTPSAGNSCRFALPVGATGVFRGTAAPGYQFIGFNGPCLEGSGPVPTCTYRGFGFVRVIEAVFQRP